MLTPARRNNYLLNVLAPLPALLHDAMSRFSVVSKESCHSIFPFGAGLGRYASPQL